MTARVMKHLKLLEEAASSSPGGGAEKLHYLNSVPIRLVHDRWVSKVAEPWAAGRASSRTDWRNDGEVYEIYIRTRPSACGQAVTATPISAAHSRRGRVRLARCFHSIQRHQATGSIGRAARGARRWASR